MKNSSVPALRWTLFVLFAISGFAGLIYESIWTHYLKLFLGHAAYAQTLVLTIFMGGLAVGAWIAGDFSQRLRQPLLAYAAAEFVIGVAALIFDPLFRHMTDWMYDSVLPHLATPGMVDLVKWSVASAIILPQTILLGMTFPLMSAGLIRTVPTASGYTLAALYFTNSIGASVGVLCSGFWLIPAVGLPGTLLTAGLLNMALAMVVWLLARSVEWQDGSPSQQAARPRESAASPDVLLMLSAAFFTGAASFFYEIGWIRMLSLVLGSATHSFELMLSAFILGLALGSYFIRKRLDRITSPLSVLAAIQIIMALFAASTLLSYDWSFDFMAFLLEGLDKTDAGYLLFNIASHGLCLALMLPATICAGMTLPLITHYLLARGQGESAIGRVYAANTVGAIVGVLLSVHVVMPLLGLKHVIAVGAAIDLLLGLYLLRRTGITRKLGLSVLVPATLTYAAIAIFSEFDVNKMSSGVFRHGQARTSGEVMFHRDGKTASVDVVRFHDSGLWTIATNGKPDAGLSFGPVPFLDESTMVMAGVLPIAFNPGIKQVAVIGFGSGLTSHTLLLSAGIESVDTIEIEPAMVEGARLFYPRVGKAFDDPRGHIYFDDAKTYFARKRKIYDAIVSEPSNPWVSGTASLFSTEFYGQVTHYLKPEGLFVQWIQLYEIDLPLLQTILRALQPHFTDYAIFLGDASDLIIVAKKSGQLPEISTQSLLDPGMRTHLERLRLGGLIELKSKRVTGRVGLDALGGKGSPNSDLFPLLDTGAAKARFLKLEALQPVHALYQLERLLYPVPRPPVSSETRRAPEDVGETAQLLEQQLKAWIMGGTGPVRPLDSELSQVALALLSQGPQCHAESARTVWLPAVRKFLTGWADSVSKETLLATISYLRKSACHLHASESSERWLALAQAIAQGNHRGIVSSSLQLANAPENEGFREVLIKFTLVAAAALKDPEVFVQLTKLHGSIISNTQNLRLLEAMALFKAFGVMKLPVDGRE